MSYTDIVLKEFLPINVKLREIERYFDVSMIAVQRGDMTMEQHKLQQDICIQIRGAIEHINAASKLCGWGS